MADEAEAAERRQYALIERLQEQMFEQLADPDDPTLYHVDGYGNVTWTGHELTARLLQSSAHTLAILQGRG